MGQQQTYALQQNLVLFDHLVGAQQERFRDGQTQRFRSLEIDDKLERGRLLDRNLCGLYSAQQLDQLPGPNVPVNLLENFEP